MDRGYVDSARLSASHKQGAFFVVRAKENLKFKRLYSSPKDKEASVKADPVLALPANAEIPKGIPGAAT